MLCLSVNRIFIDSLSLVIVISEWEGASKTEREGDRACADDRFVQTCSNTHTSAKLALMTELCSSFNAGIAFHSHYPREAPSGRDGAASLALGATQLISGVCIRNSSLQLQLKLLLLLHLQHIGQFSKLCTCIMQSLLLMIYVLWLRLRLLWLFCYLCLFFG